MPPTRAMRGLFAIPVTPFDEEGQIDEPSLHRVIQFCVEAGSHGIVTPVNVSEFSTLSVPERKLTTRVAVQEAAGRVPVVIGVCATSTDESVMLARDAEEAGADAVMSMPPYGRRHEEDDLRRFFQALSDAVHVPIFVQNHEGPVGTPMNGAFVASLCNDIEHVQYVKEESASAGAKMTETLKLAPETCLGIMGGKAGRYLFDEYRRGACGSMPACESADVHARLWNLLDSGDERGARDVFFPLLPLLNYEALFGTTVYKEVLFRRGIIRTSVKRLKGPSLDAYDMQELDAILDDLAPLYSLKTPWRRTG